MRLERRVDALEGAKQNDGMGAILDALGDPDALARLRPRRELIEALDKLDDEDGRNEGN